MKRLIRCNGVRTHQTRIIGMSLPKAKAERALSADAESLQFHIMKCVIYGNSTRNFNHWIDEIAQYIYEANTVTLKPNATKCKPQMYVDTVFSFIGDEENDAWMDLVHFQRSINRGKEDYPMFEPTKEMAKNLFNVYMKIIDTTLPILSTKNDCTKADFDSILHKLLDVYK